MRVDILSVLPDVFEAYAGSSMLGIAREKGALELRVHDLRRWALPGVHRQVDDAPYGGGSGMVLRPEPFFDAVDEIRSMDERTPLVLLMSPQGRPLTQRVVERLAGEQRLLLLCGRYEGFDDRIRSLADMEVSIGDYVLTGGELPALIVVDAVTRLLPGVLGGEESTAEESFAHGLLEYPQYTRPATYRGLGVPEVLLSGDHARIAAWREREALLRTARRRPDIISGIWDTLSDEERQLLSAQDRSERMETE